MRQREAWLEKKSSESAFPPMAHQGRRKKTENQRKKKRSRPTFPVAAPPRARSGPGRGLPGAGRGPPGGRAPGGRALTSVGATGAARTVFSELRAAVPGFGNRRAGCIAAAAASGQPPRTLHAEAPMAPAQPRVGAARLDGAPGRGALTWAGRAGVSPSVRLGARPARPLPRPLLSDPGLGRARSPTSRRPAPPSPLWPLQPLAPGYRF